MLRWLLATSLLLLAPSGAAALNVAPVLLEVTAPGAATVLTLRNSQNRALDVQLRVFRWLQVNGQDQLMPTADVVISPPIAKLQPGAEQVVRVIRVTKRPVSGEESYRVLVDELPDAGQLRDGRVKLLLRQSIPVFFAQTNLAPPRVTWSLVKERDAWLLEAINTGHRRLRVANLSLADSTGRTLVRRSGLVGYVLPGTSVRWSLGSSREVKVNGTAVITTDTEAGPINATAPVRSAR